MLLHINVIFSCCVLWHWCPVFFLLQNSSDCQAEERRDKISYRKCCTVAGFFCSLQIMPPRDFVFIPPCNKFPNFLSWFGNFNWPVFGGRRVSPSISRQTLSQCSVQDCGCGGGLEKASVRLITAERRNSKSHLWIQNYTSDTLGSSLEFPSSCLPTNRCPPLSF